VLLCTVVYYSNRSISATCSAAADVDRKAAVVGQADGQTDRRTDAVPLHRPCRILYIYTSLFAVHVETKKHTRTHTTQKIEKKHKNAYLTNNKIIKQLTNNVNRMLTSVNKLLLLH